MARPINRVPLGLLSLLELKSPAGRYPVELADSMQPQLDMLPFYRPQAHRAGLGLTAAAAIAGPNRFMGFTLGTPTIVPQGEIWMVSEYTLEIPLQTDQNIRVAPILAIPIGVQQQVFQLAEWSEFGTGTMTGPLAQLAIVSAKWGMPRILGPGMQLAFSVSHFTPGATLTTQASCSFFRLVLTV